MNDNWLRLGTELAWEAQQRAENRCSYCGRPNACLAQDHGPSAMKPQYRGASGALVAPGTREYERHHVGAF